MRQFESDGSVVIYSTYLKDQFEGPSSSNNVGSSDGTDPSPVPISSSRSPDITGDKYFQLFHVLCDTSTTVTRKRIQRSLTRAELNTEI